MMILPLRIREKTTYDKTICGKTQTIHDFAKLKDKKRFIQPGENEGTGFLRARMLREAVLRKEVISSIQGTEMRVVVVSVDEMR
jgi:hypothetical protein